MTAWQTSGEILRWWRQDVVGLTQQEVAERLNVRPSALSNWERGFRAVSVELSELDEILKGEQALAGLMWAQSSPAGIDPGLVWTKVLPGASRPVWLWSRSDSPVVDIEGEWGVARFETRAELGPNGLFVTVGASLPASPVVIRFSEPCWADFGCGSLPEQVPGADVINAIRIMRPSSADGPFMDMFSSNLANRLSARTPDAMDLAHTAPEIVSHINPGPAARPTPKVWPPEPEGIDAVERERFTRLRRARGLSWLSTVDRLRVETGTEVGRDTLRRFETDVGRPHDPMLPVALDHLLGACGRLAVLELRAGRGSGSVTFPPYWRGPIWLAVEDTNGAGHLSLQRGHWRRELDFDQPTLVSAHWFDPSAPLRFEAPPTTRWAAGVGRRRGATSIDQNWVPVTVDVAQQAIGEVEEALRTAVDRR